MFLYLLNSLNKTLENEKKILEMAGTAPKLDYYLCWLIT